MLYVMHICYLFVFDFGVLKNIGFTFDHRYVFQMEEDGLYIEKSTSPLPLDFWVKEYSLTAIVGNNGSGKTTALRLMK